MLAERLRIDVLLSSGGGVDVVIEQNAWLRRLKALIGGPGDDSLGSRNSSSLDAHFNNNFGRLVQLKESTPYKYSR